LISKTDIAETLVEMSLVKPTTVYSFKKWPAIMWVTTKHFWIFLVTGFKAFYNKKFLIEPFERAKKLFRLKRAKRPFLNISTGHAQVWYTYPQEEESSTRIMSRRNPRFRSVCKHHILHQHKRNALSTFIECNISSEISTKTQNTGSQTQT
jgi:hypothetical protein